jgi:hypothetical protein
MNRTTLNLAIDLTALGLFLGMAATGYILWFAVPPGTNKALSLWGLARHEWGTVHAWISFFLLATLFLHTCQHWQWLVSVVRKRLHLESAPHRGLLSSGLVAFVVTVGLFGLFCWATQSGVRPITEPEQWDVCPPGESERTEAIPTPTSSAGRKESGAPPAFWQDVYPILEKACLSCHGPNKQRGHFRVDRREDFFGKAGKPALVVPGASVRSPLIAIVSGQRKDLLRPELHQLPESTVAVLSAWIEAGAEWPADGEVR